MAANNFDPTDLGEPPDRSGGRAVQQGPATKPSRPRNYEGVADPHRSGIGIDNPQQGPAPRQRDVAARTRTATRTRNEAEQDGEHQPPNKGQKRSRSMDDAQSKGQKRSRSMDDAQSKGQKRSRSQ